MHLIMSSCNWHSYLRNLQLCSALLLLPLLLLGSDTLVTTISFNMPIVQSIMPACPSLWNLLKLDRISSLFSCSSAIDFTIAQLVRCFICCCSNSDVRSAGVELLFPGRGLNLSDPMYCGGGFLYALMIVIPCQLANEQPKTKALYDRSIRRIKIKAQRRKNVCDELCVAPTPYMNRFGRCYRAVFSGQSSRWKFET